MDDNSLTDPTAQTFLTQLMLHRNANREYFRLVPEDKLDFHMVDTPDRKSDSPRDSLVHQIYVTKKYIYAAKHGELKFDGIVDNPLQNTEHMSKQDLLSALEATEAELVGLLSQSDIATRKVKVSWSAEPVPVVTMLYGLRDHEILHAGWNLAIMDHLNIERFPKFKALWG